MRIDKWCTWNPLILLIIPITKHTNKVYTEQNPLADVPGLLLYTVLRNILREGGSNQTKAFKQSAIFVISKVVKKQ